MIKDKTKEGVQCPLCGGLMPLVDNLGIWSCEACPAILFEYYSSLVALESYLKEGKK